MTGYKASLFVWNLCFCFGAGWSCVGAAHAQGQQTRSAKDTAEITTVLPTKSIQVARPFEFKIQVESDRPVMIELSGEASKSLGDFQIVGQHSLGPIAMSQDNTDERYRTTLAFMLEADRAGQRNLPALKVQVSAGEDSFHLVSDAATVDVQGVVPTDFDPTQFRELKPFTKLDPASDSTSIAYWLMVPIFLLIGVGVFLSWRRSTTSDAAIRKRWIAEIDSLQSDLNNRSITLPVAHDETCVRIRHWIQSSTGIPASSLPTDSLIADMRSRRWSESLLQKLSETLRRNDRLKFSAIPELSDGASAVFDDARWMIRHQDLSDATEAKP